jgi:hypothetical protein
MTDLKRLLLKCGSVVDSNLHQAMILENIEYYDPYDGRGLGGKNFSWTAAFMIDMIHRSKENNIRIN